MVKKKKDKCKQVAEVSYFLLRIALGIFFFLSGLPKVQALMGGANPLAGFGLAIWLAWFVGIVELLGGAFLVFGFLAKESGSLIAIIMLGAVITLLVTGNMDLGSVGGWKLLFQHLLYVGAAMIVALKPKGLCSIDSLWRK